MCRRFLSVTTPFLKQILLLDSETKFSKIDDLEIYKHDSVMHLPVTGGDDAYYDANDQHEPSFANKT